MWKVSYKFGLEYPGAGYDEFNEYLLFDTEDEARADIKAEKDENPKTEYILYNDDEFVERG